MKTSILRFRRVQRHLQFDLSWSWYGWICDNNPTCLDWRTEIRRNNPEGDSGIVDEIHF